METIVPVDYNCDVFQADDSIIPANNLLSRSQPIFFVKISINLSTYVVYSNFTVDLTKTSEDIESRYMTFDELEESSVIRTMIASSYPGIDTHPDMWPVIISRISQCARNMVRDNARAKILPMVVMTHADVYVDEDDEEAEEDEEVIPMIWRYMDRDIENVRIGEADQDTCAICLDLVRAGTEGARLACNKHVYHRRCIGKWLKKSRFCPMCRYELPA